MDGECALFLDSCEDSDIVGFLLGPSSFIFICFCLFLFVDRNSILLLRSFFSSVCNFFLSMPYFVYGDKFFIQQ